MNASARAIREYLRRETEVVDGDIHAAYRHERNRKLTFTVLMVALAVVMFFLTLGVGTYKIGEWEAIQVMFDHLSGNITDAKGDYYVWTYRVPRAIAAIVAGVGLAIGGVVMQNLLKNPLAEPYTMGVSSGAMFGVTLSIGLGISIVPWFGEDIGNMINAFIFSLIPVAIILAISAFKKVTPTMMILVGIAVMYLFTSVTQIVLVTSSSETMTEIYSWNIGTLARADWDNLPMLTVMTFAISAAIYLLSRKLDVMYVGDRSAQSLGLKVNAFRLTALVLTCLLTATIVCCTGTIGFVGLVAPHVARIFVGSTNRYLIPASAAFGAAFLICADTIAKAVGNGVLPVGVISSLVGGPLFLYILVTQRKHAWM